MKKIYLLLAVWLIVINAFALVALNRYNLSVDTAYTWIPPDRDRFHQVQSWNLIDLHARWDSEWYLDIAEHGYYLRGYWKLANPSFLPLYPVLIRATSYLTTGHLALAGWIVSVVFLGLSAWALRRLVREFHPKLDPETVTWYLLIFPTAFVLQAVYTESLFLFLSISAIYYALKKNYLAAGVFGFLGALTRHPGILIIIPLALEYWRAHGLKGFWSWRWTPLLFVPAGTVSFFAYHYFKFGDFFLFFTLQKWWGRPFGFNPEHFIFNTPPAIINFSLDALAVVFGLVAIVMVWKRLRVSYALYMLASLALPLSSGSIAGISRYMLVLFPIFLWIAGWKNELSRRAWMLVSILLLGVYITLFVNHYWAG